MSFRSHTRRVLKIALLLYENRKSIKRGAETWGFRESPGYVEKELNHNRKYSMLETIEIQWFLNLSRVSHECR